MKTKTGATTQKYRLLADGTIIDQETWKACAYITGPELDEIWNLPSKERQVVLREKVAAND